MRRQTVGEQERRKIIRGNGVRARETERRGGQRAEELGSIAVG